MDHKITILPGIPFDDNREYLPLSIKQTQKTLNENGNNSHVYPHGLLEFHECILDEEEDSWFEYVPASYDPSKPTPVVFSMHGGFMNGWGQAIYSSWTLVADREGFICVFPNSHKDGLWELEMSDAMKRVPVFACTDKAENSRDAKFVLKLLERMKEKYNVDSGRIFMHGMSMGNMMTTMFAYTFGNLLAGAGGSAGPTDKALLFNADGSVRNAGGPVPVFQTRPECNSWPNDYSPEGIARNDASRRYWMEINECEAIPQIAIRGEDNLAFYKGKKADYVFLDIKNRDHGQALDEAELMWDYLFSGVRRDTDGQIKYSEPKAPRKGDDFAVAISEDCSNAWFLNSIIPVGGKVLKWQKLKYHGLQGGAQVRGEYLCTPLRFLAAIFDAEYQESEDTLSVTLKLKDGRVVQFARGTIICTIDDRIEAMLCEAIHRDGMLYVSFEWFCRSLFNLHVTSMAGTIYATDHYSILSNNMANILHDLLS